MCKAEYMSNVGHSLGKYFTRGPQVWEKKKWCIFAGMTYDIKSAFSKFENFSSSRFVPPPVTTNRIWKKTSDEDTAWQRTSYNDLCMVELCRRRVANLLSHSEQWLKSDPLSKNRIEFQQGNKLPGTSS